MTQNLFPDMQNKPSNHDKVITLRGSHVQHGFWNDRVYLMSVDHLDIPDIVTDVVLLSQKYDYGKIFAKVPGSVRKSFYDAGFAVEATIPNGLLDGDDLLFMSLFVNSDRANYRNQEKCEKVLQALTNCSSNQEVPQLPNKYEIVSLGPEHAQKMAEIYSQVFLSYPFPIDSPDYIREIMKDGCANFYGVRNVDSELIALSSNEINYKYGIAEMTDFATLPLARGKYCAGNLLQMMEKDAAEKNVVTAFTIARAFSAPMNRVFARSGYRYGGTLKQNTNIGGDLEDMNVWFKYL